MTNTYAIFGAESNFVLGVSGHLDIASLDHDRLLELVELRLQAYRATLTTPHEFFLATGLARGSDQLVAQVALRLGWKLIAVLAMPVVDFVQNEDFREHPEAVQGFEQLLQHCEDRVIELDVHGVLLDSDIDQAHHQLYRNQSTFLVKHCHAMLTLWDEQEFEPGGCGTAYTVHLCQSQHQPDRPYPLEIIPVRRRNSSQIGQTIFLSYAHKSTKADDFDDAQDLVQLIKAELHEQGHTVWIDHEGIQSGDNWRERITQAIQSHTHFLSFLSKRAVRQPGVCLNEIAIAIGSHRQIQTLLVESEDNVRPPLTLSHIQWHQFEGWRAIYEGKATGSRGEDWQAWFSEKMKAIRSNLTDAQHQHALGELQLLKDILNPQTFESEIIKSIHSFFGRQWLFTACEQWLNHTTKRLFWLKAGPGIGKSAFAAKLVHHANSSVVGFFKCEFQSHKSPEEAASECVKTIAFQLASRLPDYRRKLLYQQQIDADKVQKRTANDLFKFLIAEPLNSSGKIPEATRLIIIIDALDEAGRNDGHNALADLIEQHADTLPEWLGILVTSRPEPYLNRQLGHFDSTEIYGDRQENLADLSDYLDSKLSPTLSQSRRDQVTAQIIDKSEGTFLYVRLLDEQLSDPDIDVDQLPNGITGIFHRNFKRYFPNSNDYLDEIEPFLRLLAYSPGPLPIALAAEVLQMSERKISIRILEPLGSLIQEKKDGLAFFHKSIADWLKNSKLSGTFQVETDGDQLLGAYLWSRWCEQNTQWETKILQWLPSLVNTTVHWNDLEAVASFAEYLEYKLQFRSAISLRHRHLTLTGVHYAQDALEYADSLCRLATLLRIVCKFDDAHQCLQQALQIQDERQACQTPLYVRTLEELGLVVKELVRLRDAIVLFDNALKTQLAISDADPMALARCYNYLAETHDALGEFEPAIKQYTRGLQIYLDQNEIQTLSCASIMNNYAVVSLRRHGGLVFEKQGPFTFESEAFAHAEQLFAYSAQIIAAQSGTQTHPDEASALNNQGLAQHNQGHTEQAQASFLRAIDIAQRTLGNEHPSVATALNNLGALQYCEGHAQAAVVTLNKALHLFEKSIGEDHPHSARVLNNLGLANVSLNQDYEAKQAWQRSLVIYLQTLGQTHCDTAQAQCLWGLYQFKHHQLDQASQLLHQVLQTRTNALGLTHPQTGAAHVHVMRVLMAKGNLAQARDHAQAAVQIFKQWPRGYAQALQIMQADLHRLELNVPLQPLNHPIDEKSGNDLLLAHITTLMDAIKPSQLGTKTKGTFMRMQLEVLDAGRLGYAIAPTSCAQS